MITPIRVLRAEWTKLRTAASTGWLVVTAVALIVALGSLVAAGTSTRHCPTLSTCEHDTVKLSLIGVHFGQVTVAVLAVLAITNEYSTRLIQTTLTAMPNRAAVWAAKAALAATVGVVVGALGVAGSLLAAGRILPHNGFTVEAGYAALSLADEPTRRAALGTILYIGLIALLSLSIGAILRDTAGSLTAVLALLYLSPMVRMVISDPRWQHRLDRYAPMTAGLAVQTTRNLGALAIGPWAGLGVLACYAAGALLLGALVFQVRDA